MTVPAPRPPVSAGSSGYRRLVIALMVGGLANFSVMYFVQPLLPLLAVHYHVSATDSAHALSATTAATIVGLLLVGPLADRFGRVPVMKWSLLASGVLGVASAFAPGWGALVLLRALLGLSVAGFPAAALAYLRQEVHPGSHPRANAWYIVGTGVGGATGRLLPDPIAAIGGWPLAAVTMGTLTLIAAGAVWVLLPRSERFTPRRVAVREVFTGTFTALKDRVVRLLCLTGFVAMGSFVALYNAVAFRLQAPPYVLGTAAVVVYFAYPLGLFGPALLRWLAEIRGRGRAVLIGFALLGVSVAFLAIESLFTIMAGLSLVTFAFLGVHAQLSAWTVDRAVRVRIGPAQASSAYLILYYLGSTLCGVAGTWLWEHHGWPGVSVFTGLLVILGMAAVARASASDRQRRA